MKPITLTLLLAIFAVSANSQNITNTLGTGGVFTIKDASNSYLTLSQTNGLLSLNNNLSLPITTSSSLGVITKGGVSFIHDFAPLGAQGDNTFVGRNSGNFTMLGTGNQSSNNTGIGTSSLGNLTSGYCNTAVGFLSLSSNTTGYNNIAIGVYSLTSNTTGNANIAVGYDCLSQNTTGYANIAMGQESLHLNASGFFNTAIGFQSLQDNTTGYNNTAVGNYSLFGNTTGAFNTAVGNNSLYHSLGNFNTAMGDSSLYSNTSGYNNTAVGHQSLQSNTYGQYNTAVGDNSLGGNTTGYENTAVGSFSLHSNTSGFFNTAIGDNSLGYSTTGQQNLAVGYYAGANVTTGSNNICIGYNASASAATTTNEITLGNQYATIFRCAVLAITALSDARDKKNISDLTLGIDFLMKIKPRLFNWDKREWYRDNKSDGSKMQKTPTAGFIAQELDEVQTKENAEWLNLVLKDNPNKLEATPGNLLPVMVKAIQQLKTENDELKDKLDKFERIQGDLVAEIEKLKSKDVELKQVKDGK